jgi:hypothetical protein
MSPVIHLSPLASFFLRFSVGTGQWPLMRASPDALFVSVSGHQKLLRTAKRSAFQPVSIKFVGAKTIQNQHKHIIG